MSAEQKSEKILLQMKEVENEPDDRDDDDSYRVVHVFTIYKREKYMIKIGNDTFDKFQIPSAILSEDGFYEILNNGLDGAEISTENLESKKQIGVKIIINEKYHIKFTLSIDKKFIYPLENRVAELEEELNKIKVEHLGLGKKYLDLEAENLALKSVHLAHNTEENKNNGIYELDSVRYPKWDSFEEFKKLPEYKYVEMSLEFYEYVVNIEGLPCIKISDDTYLAFNFANYSSRLLHNGSQFYERGPYTNPCKRENEYIGCGMHVSHVYSDMPGYIKKDMDDIFTHDTIENKSNSYDTNHGPTYARMIYKKSCTVSDYSNKNTIGKNIMRFFLQYCFGWACERLDIMECHPVKLKIVVEGNEARCHIMHDPDLKYKILNVYDVDQKFLYKILLHPEQYFTYEINGEDNIYHMTKA